MNSRKPIIGILALQGSVIEHFEMIEKSGAKAKKILKPEDLEGISGIILPGGESTTIGKLLVKNHLFDPLREKIKNGLPTWGTCAGAILLGKSGSEFSMQIADFGVQRNGFGRQIASFRAEVEITNISKNFPAIFIRAPRFENIDETKIEVLARYEGEAIFLQQKNIWAMSFHPELSDDPSVHRAFIEFCKKGN